MLPAAPYASIDLGVSGTQFGEQALAGDLILPDRHLQAEAIYRWACASENPAKMTFFKAHDTVQLHLTPNPAVIHYPANDEEKKEISRQALIEKNWNGTLVVHACIYSVKIITPIAVASYSLSQVGNTDPFTSISLALAFYGGVRLGHIWLQKRRDETSVQTIGFTSTLSLQHLPADILHCIRGYLTLREQFRAGKTCKRLYALFHPAARNQFLGAIPAEIKEALGPHILASAPFFSLKETLDKTASFAPQKWVETVKLNNYKTDQIRNRDGTSLKNYWREDYPPLLNKGGVKEVGIEAKLIDSLPLFSRPNSAKAPFFMTIKAEELGGENVCFFLDRLNRPGILFRYSYIYENKGNSKTEQGVMVLQQAHPNDPDTWVAADFTESKFLFMASKPLLQVVEGSKNEQEYVRWGYFFREGGIEKCGNLMWLKKFASGTPLKWLLFGREAQHPNAPLVTLAKREKANGAMLAPLSQLFKT